MYSFLRKLEFIAVLLMPFFWGASLQAGLIPLKKNEVKDYLHVPSPKWEDQIIYFLMIDRFADGNSNNNDQGRGEYDPSDNRKYSGGDIKGVIDHLDYIFELGITSLWMTPPVANQWWDPWVNYGGYHGYWATDFTKVDKHYGTLEEYRTLSALLHKNGMYLIQDIICNHMGNFYYYKGKYNAKDPTENFNLNQKSYPPSAVGPLFNMNDVRNPAHRKAGIFRFTPSIDNYQDPYQVLNYQMSDLDELNTKNPKVRNALKDAYSFWIKDVGVDGFRVDTALYVEHDFWHDFFHSKDEDHPGIVPFAKKLGKQNFFSFGEAWVNTSPFSDKGDRIARTFIGSKNKPEMTTIINFPLHITIKSVFGEGKPTNLLTYRLNKMMELYDNPNYLVNFIDNHDMDRFLASSSHQAFKNALFFMMTAPGIPVIYYGTEQGFKETRQAMFKGGFSAGDKDHFDTQSPSFVFIKELIALRKNNLVFSRGDLTVLKDSKSEAGVFAYRRKYKDEMALVLLNTSDRPKLVTDIATGLPSGTILKRIYGLSSSTDNLQVSKEGALRTILPPKSAVVLMPSLKVAKRDTTTKGMLKITSSKAVKPLTKKLTLTGKVKGIDKFWIAIDDTADGKIGIKVDKSGHFRGVVNIDSLTDGLHTARAYAIVENELLFSSPYQFRKQTSFYKQLNINDKIGDDNGPSGKYLYPTDKSFNRNMDINRVKVGVNGSKLVLEIKMHQKISTSWNPKFGFDHVSFNIYLDIPTSEQNGKLPKVKVMPFQNSLTPKNMHWNYLAHINGWGNYLFTSDSASKTNNGTPVALKPIIRVDKKNQLITLEFPAKALGDPKSFKGTKLYITTWDFDGLENKFRPLAPNAGAFSFGGGGKDDPLVMDDTVVIEL